MTTVTGTAILAPNISVTAALMRMRYSIFRCVPDSNVHGPNMGPIWGRQDPGGPHVGPMNLAIWGCNDLTQMIRDRGMNLGNGRRATLRSVVAK